MATNSGYAVWDNTTGTGSNYVLTATGTGINTFHDGSLDWINSATITICQGGHRIDGEFIEYIDGVFVGTCDLCGCRVVFQIAPGGSNAKRIEGLLLELLDGDEEFSTEQLELLADISQQIEEEADALDRSLKLLMLAQEVVKQRVS